MRTFLKTDMREFYPPPTPVLFPSHHFIAYPHLFFHFLLTILFVSVVLVHLLIHEYFLI
jgi:hypothetical protein